VPPDHELLRHHYTSAAPPSRVTVSFVVQPEPRGTADAVLASEGWTNREAFLVLNGDNLYPTAGLGALAQLDEPGLLAFERDDLVRSGNIPADRVASFALIDLDDRGYLTQIVEKPELDLPPNHLRQGYGGPPKLYAKAEASESRGL
jgi:glucose-1-phosphate thymidylyltransferase